MTPDRGDVLHLTFDPASGREMKGEHYCLVVSPRSFNQRFKLAIVCPISQGAAETARSGGFLVTLMGTGMRTAGNVHVHQVKSLDWGARKAKPVERAPEQVVEEVRQLLNAVIEDD
jgi:mRNA interferase ChpB